MNNFTFYSPTYYSFGKDTENGAGKLIKQFGGSKALILYGGGSVKRSGLLDRVKGALDKESVPYVELGGVKPNPRDGLVYEAIDLIQKEGVDFILAIGGGSVIDTAKATAAGAVYDGDFWDFFSGKAIEKALPIGAILTIAASGSEGSPDIIMTKEEGMLKRAADSDFVRPKFAIMNPALTQTLPPYQTACGVTDIMSHLYERYITRTEDVEVTDRMIEGLLIALKNMGPRVMADPDDYEARANIMWAGSLAHNNVCGVGRSQDWTSHQMEHELSALYDCAHGAGMAMMMPAVFKFEKKQDVMRFANIAVRVWGCEMDPDDPEKTALAGIQALSDFTTSLGMPSKLSDIGGSEEDIPTLVHNLCRAGGRDGKVHCYMTLDEDDCTEIYRNLL